MKFVALPVAQGDAFYAETDDRFRVLVDGGRSQWALPELFLRYTRSRGVNVLVCTHNDADHAEGVIGFLKSCLDCEELWLPDTWIAALQSVPPDVGATLQFLRERFAKVELEPLLAEGEGDVQERAWQAVFPQLRGEQFEGVPEEESATEGELRPAFLGAVVGDALPAIDEHLEVTYWLIARRWRWPFLYWYGDRLDALLATTLKDVRRLLEVARLALDRGVPVRCFSHDPVRAASIPGCSLIPLSGRSVRHVRPSGRRRDAKTFWYYAFLTTVNRRSLVCYLESEGQPGVLFSADSDLREMDLSRVQDWSVATAPHHGSRDNRDAYGRVGRPMVWVRSDGYSQVRPCGEYLSAPGKRFCTLCRNSGRQKQRVRLCLRNSGWIPLQTRPCECS